MLDKYFLKKYLVSVLILYLLELTAIISYLSLFIFMLGRAPKEITFALGSLSIVSVLGIFVYLIYLAKLKTLSFKTKTILIIFSFTNSIVLHPVIYSILMIWYK